MWVIFSNIALTHCPKLAFKRCDFIYNVKAAVKPHGPQSGAIMRSAISAQAASIARLNCASDYEDSHLDDDDDEASGDLPDASHDAHWAHRQAG